MTEQRRREEGSGEGRRTRTRSCHAEFAVVPSELRSADSVNRQEERERDRARRGRRPGCGADGGRAGATRKTRALFVAPILLRESPKRKLVVPSPIPFSSAELTTVVLDSGKALATALLLVGFAT